MKASRCASLLLAIAALVPTAAVGQATNSEPNRGARSGEPVAVDCQAIARDDVRLDLVVKLCEFALGYQNQLPNFIVQQTTTFENASSKTVMTAEVTFQKGLESYSRVTVNGRPAPVSRITTKPPDEVQFSSTGEFGPALLDLFRVPGATQFKFKTTSTLQNQPVAIYEFHVPQKNNLFWTVRPGDGRTMKPEFNGELWLEQQTGKPLREEIEPTSLLVGAEIVSTKTVIDYAMTAVGNAGTFLLPSKSESTMCKRGVQETANCTKNVLVFHGYRKFGAATRIIPSAAQP
jgi:hypothetical protein